MNKWTKSGLVVLLVLVLIVHESQTLAIKAKIAKAIGLASKFLIPAAPCCPLPAPCPSPCAVTHVPVKHKHHA